MTIEQYKAYIVDMLDGISDLKRLRQIYTVVHHLFINERIKKCKEGVRKNDNRRNH